MSHITTLVKEAQKRLYFLHKLKKLRSQILVNFYKGVIESLLTRSITNWHGSSRPRTGRLYSR